MNLIKAGQDLFCPSGLPLEKTTHLCIASHQDDVEIMAAAPILECFGRSDKQFTAVVVSDGAGSPRSGVYADFTDEDMKKIRVQEQHKAALIGGYLAVLQLGYTSAAIKQRENKDLVNDLCEILLKTAPETVYVHNLMDKHPTHVATVVKTIQALRSLPKDKRPRRVISCEVWRGLDWLCDSDKVILDTSPHPNISGALVGVFDSQISGGKRYDLAATGRRVANATYFDSHSVDSCESMNFGLDITELIEDDDLSTDTFVMGHIEKFGRAVKQLLETVG